MDVLKTEKECLLTENVFKLFLSLKKNRNESEENIRNLYLAARAEDKEITDSIVLYARNIRNNGAAEKRVGRILLNTLAMIDPAKIRRNFSTIVENGRWDDLYILEGTPVEYEMYDFIRKQLMEDIESYRKGEKISLLAKWLPSINASSKETQKKARRTIAYLGFSEKKYRKTLSLLRGYLDIVEVKLSKKQLESITFNKVPCCARNKYRNVLKDKDGVIDIKQRQKSFVSEGEEDINSIPYKKLIREPNKAVISSILTSSCFSWR